MDFQAAIFDLDGTLINSLEDLANSANAMLVSYGFPEHSLDAYRYFVGNGSQKLIERCLPEKQAADPMFVVEALQRYKEIYAQHTEDRTRPYEGILSALRALKKKGIPLGICTNKHQSAADEIVSHMFPAGLFRDVVGDRPGLPRKPNPQKVLQMAEEFGVAPNCVAYFGDTSVDMDTAHHAGFYAVGVLWGFRPKGELVAHGADLLLASPREITEKLSFQCKETPYDIARV
ncbi:HAD family hydrolase [Selenomonas sp.]|jgi:phosphoglycolate phosphatase|uniref:HAD family hydrolase n=1 Tax=Selenomonas sp. TaxID=2053611 RepID=UPI003A0FCC6A